MKLTYSFIIPVYNRPEEIEELLQSFTAFTTSIPFQVVIVEDGSTHSSKDVVRQFQHQLDIVYLAKANSGPGDSRNYGMQRASGNYFIILDSDVVMPPSYLDEVHTALSQNYYDCFGGPDDAHASFSPIQKAINFVMTSWVTTGGIRGSEKAVKDFEPRSFNMGISKEAFEATKGFGTIHPGEDPDLAIRIRKAGFKTGLIPKAIVFHKRRISWDKFYTQVYKFGMVRVILNQWHPETKSLVFYLPSLFILGFFISLLLLSFWVTLFGLIYLAYFLLVFCVALSSTKSIRISLMAIRATFIQFLGYGLGFLRSTYYIRLLGRDPKKVFPNLFFK